jgi:hypothetical protein
MKRLSLFLFLFLSLSIKGGEFEYAKFIIGPDKFNSSTGVFQRLNCDDENAPETKIYLSLEPEQLDIVLKLAKVDISQANADIPDDFSKLCVSSFPYQISLHKTDQVLATTCLSPIDEYKSKLAKFVYDLDEIKNLKGSKCKFY